MPASRNRYLEFKPQFEELFAKSAKASRIGLFVLLGIGGACMIAAVIILLQPGDKWDQLSFVVAGLGAFFGLLVAGIFLFSDPDKQARKTLDALENDPGSLVWSYVLRQTTNGVTTVFVVMKFRGKWEYKLQERLLPSKDGQAFLKLLLYINPDMKVGFYDGYRQSYRRNEL